MASGKTDFILKGLTKASRTLDWFAAAAVDKPVVSSQIRNLKLAFQSRCAVVRALADGRLDREITATDMEWVGRLLAKIEDLGGGGTAGAMADFPVLDSLAREVLSMLPGEADIDRPPSGGGRRPG